MDSFIKVNDLHKRFGSVTAVRHLDLEIKKGEFFTLLGPSGCGKTTTLRLIGGLEKPDQGEILIDGQCLSSAKRRIFINPEKRNIGMVFQSYALWPHMTVFKNVAFPLKLRGFSKNAIRTKVSEVLDSVGLSGLEEREAPQLSGGQQQRVALARALVFSPRLLLLDEPLSNLDAKLRDEMRRELKGLQRRLGLTVVLVTHDQIEALSLSDRVGIMNLGNLDQIGTPQEIYHRPTTPFVRDFLGKVITLPGTVVAATQDHVDVKLKELESQPLRVKTAQGSYESGIKAGSDVMVAIRPEHITVTNSAPIEKCNVVNATVQESLFLGDRNECHVVMGSQVRTLLLPTSQVFRPGEKLFLQLQSKFIMLWKL